MGQLEVALAVPVVGLPGCEALLPESSNTFPVACLPAVTLENIKVKIT